MMCTPPTAAFAGSSDTRATFAIEVTARAPSTESAAVTTNDTAVPVELVAAAEIGAGSVSTGGVVSTTVTVKLAVPALPSSSVALQLTVVAPIANIEPEAGVQTVVSDVS